MKITHVATFVKEFVKDSERNIIITTAIIIVSDLAHSLTIIVAGAAGLTGKISGARWARIICAGLTYLSMQYFT